MSREAHTPVATRFGADLPVDETLAEIGRPFEAVKDRIRSAPRELLTPEPEGQPPPRASD